MLPVFEPHATISVKAAHEVLEHIHETPVGLVKCGCYVNHNGNHGTCFVVCRDGRMRKLRYTCPRCKRFVPYCYGAADAFSRVCDDCHEQLCELARHVVRLREVSLFVDVVDPLYVPLHDEVLRWADSDLTTMQALEARLHML
jgi:hypothetical protein